MGWKFAFYGWPNRVGSNDYQLLPNAFVCGLQMALFPHFIFGKGCKKLYLEWLCG